MVLAKPPWSRKLLHSVNIDYHWDALEMDDSAIGLLKAHDLSDINEYLSLENGDGAPLVRWDNYIDPMRVLRPNYEGMYFHAFQQDPGSRVLNDPKADWSNTIEWWENLNYWDEKLEETRLIINLDLDYFLP